MATLKRRGRIYARGCRFVPISSGIRTFQQLTLMTLANLGPSILTVLTKMIAKLRWEETSYVPLSRVRFRLSKSADSMLI